MKLTRVWRVTRVFVYMFSKTHSDSTAHVRLMDELLPWQRVRVSGSLFVYETHKHTQVLSLILLYRIFSDNALLTARSQETTLGE